MINRFSHGCAQLRSMKEEYGALQESSEFRVDAGRS
jgi:hypothetical protein